MLTGDVQNYERVEITRIIVDGGLQTRAELDQFVIDDYAQAMRDGIQFPPLVVFQDDGDLWLADGFHRIMAANQAGLTDFPADIRQGSRRDAILFAVGANGTHGLRRTNADKRKAALTLLNDPEWNQWSDREIARRAGVSNQFVSNLRTHLSVNGGQMERKVTRRGATYTQKTVNIGRGRTIEPEIRELIGAGMFTKDREIKLLARSAPQEQKKIVDKVLSGEATDPGHAKRIVQQEQTTKIPQSLMPTELQALIEGSVCKLFGKREEFKILLVMGPNDTFPLVETADFQLTSDLFNEYWGRPHEEIVPLLLAGGEGIEVTERGIWGDMKLWFVSPARLQNLPCSGWVKIGGMDGLRGLPGI